MSTTVVLQHTSVYDSDIISSNPTTKYGSGTLMAMGEHNAAVQIARILINFAGLSNGDVPKNRTVLSAKLSMYLATDASNTGRNYDVYRCKRDVVESEVTWNQYSAGNNWQTAGGWGNDDNEKVLMARTALTASEAVGFKDWNLDTDMVFEMINGVWTPKWLMVRTLSEYNDQYVFRTTQHGTTTSHPKLTITLADYVGGVIFM